MAKLSVQEIIDALKELTVLELNDLVTACEEEFGVSAAAGVAVVAAGPAAAAEEEKTEFDVELTEIGDQKIKVIKVVRDATGFSHQQLRHGKGDKIGGNNKDQRKVRIGRNQFFN